MMRAKLAYFPIGLWAVMHLIIEGYRPYLFWSWLAIAWVWIGLKITNREIGTNQGGGLVYTWFWPVYLIRNGVFRYPLYSICLNGIEVGCLDGQRVKTLFQDVLSTPTIYLDQLGQWVRAAIAGLLITMVLTASVIVLGVLYLGKSDGHLLVEIIRSWLEAGTIPYAGQIFLIIKVSSIGMTIALARNCIAEEFHERVRITCGRAELGRIQISPIHSYSILQIDTREGRV